MSAGDAHAVVKNALNGTEGMEGDFSGVADLRLSDLNETEREHAENALRALDNLDEALSVRSGFESTTLGRDETGGSDE